MAHHFGRVEERALVEIVPTVGVAIHVIRPTPQQESLILFTTGMSDRPQNVPDGEDEYRHTELFIRLHADWPLGAKALRDPNYFWPVEWLRRIAAYPHENDTWLGGPYTIIATDDPPAPLAPNTRQSCLLLLQEPDDEGTVRCRDGRLVVLYSVVPLYTEERDLEADRGMEELLGRFESRGISMEFNPSRVNVAKRR
jgi:hypothetical protein